MGSGKSSKNTQNISLIVSKSVFLSRFFLKNDKPIRRTYKRIWKKTAKTDFGVHVITWPKQKIESRIRPKTNRPNDSSSRNFGAPKKLRPFANCKKHGRLRSRTNRIETKNKQNGAGNRQMFSAFGWIERMRDDNFTINVQIGGFRMAFQNLGGECVFSSEWDEQAKKTYYANYGEVPFGDITKESTKNKIGYIFISSGSF